MAEDTAVETKPAPAEEIKPAAAPATAVAPDAPAAPGARDNRGHGGYGGGHGGGQRGRGRGRGDRRDRSDEPKSDLYEKVVALNRCAKVVKGGRRFSFSALIVMGDKKGKVGIGFGKANEVADAIRKATDGAKKKMTSMSLQGGTIPHEVTGRFGGGVVFLRPASPGTGVIAGGGVRSVVEAVGIKDLLAKSLGSNNSINVVKATLDALSQLRGKEAIFKARGKVIKEKKTEAKAEAAKPETAKA
jgi:small subunit ribosomal protein S5